MLERAEARHRVERAEGVAGDPARVGEVDVEAVALARRVLRGREGDADTLGALEQNLIAHLDYESSTSRRRSCASPTASANGSDGTRTRGLRRDRPAL